MKSLNIVAHPDDDLLFFSPDIFDDKLAYIYYVTMGDDGRGKAEWERKRLGLLYTYENYPNIRLVFGNIKSNSFRNGDKYGSLHSMWHGGKGEDIDNGECNRKILDYRIERLIDNLKPDIIRTHNPDLKPQIESEHDGDDHIDHIYTAKFVQKAAVKHFAPVYAYTGYPIRSLPSNISSELKTEMWRRYQATDPMVVGEQWDVALDKCYKKRIQ